MIELARE